MCIFGLQNWILKDFECSMIEKKRGEMKNNEIWKDFFYSGLKNWKSSESDWELRAKLKRKRKNE